METRGGEEGKRSGEEKRGGIHNHTTRLHNLSTSYIHIQECVYPHHECSNTEVLSGGPGVQRCLKVPHLDGSKDRDHETKDTNSRSEVTSVQCNV